MISRAMATSREFVVVMFGQPREPSVAQQQPQSLQGASPALEQKAEAAGAGAESKAATAANSGIDPNSLQIGQSIPLGVLQLQAEPGADAPPQPQQPQPQQQNAPAQLPAGLQEVPQPAALRDGIGEGDVACVAKIQACRMLPDGRSLLEASVSRRVIISRIACVAFWSGVLRR